MNLGKKMTRTIKHDTNKITPNCQCSWCNPARARAEYFKKRAKRDFNDEVIKCHI